MSLSEASEGRRQYTSLFNPGEIQQSNQEHQKATARNSPSQTELEDDKKIRDHDNGESGGGASDSPSYKAESEEIPDINDVESFDDDAYEPSILSHEDEDHPQRLNKFRGPPSTWRDWTKQERHDLAALESIRARDLSVHLYNAFILKRKAKGINAMKRVSKAATGESQNKRRRASSVFAPHRGWCAWPMPADAVPRPHERANKDPDDAWTIKMPIDDRPSAELEECIIAHMIKTATLRFAARQWDQWDTQQHENEAHLVDENSEDLKLRGESNLNDVGSSPALKPTVQTDDETSRRLLRPEARNILSRVDELLLNLQESRNSCNSISRTAISSKPTPPRVERPAFGRDLEKSPNDRGSKATENELDGTDEEDEAILISPSSRGPGSTVVGHRDRTPETVSAKQKEVVRFGLRDWSEVLGMASLTGWPTGAVSRASRRCADLFGEDQAFRTMYEGTVQLARADDGMPYWTHVEPVDVEAEEKEPLKDRSLSRSLDNPKKDVAYCPVKGCSRHLRGFSRAWNLNQHLKNAHSDLLAESKIQLAKRVYK